MFERRKTTRRRTFLAGRVEVEKLNGWAVACAVRNLSETGARIAMPPDVIVPCVFELAVSGGAPKPARLVWYKDGYAGVALIDPEADGRQRLDAARPTSTAGEPTLLQARIAAIAANSGRRTVSRRTIQ